MALLDELKEALASAPKTTSRQVLAALQSAIAAIESTPTLSTSSECAKILDGALSLRAGVMDSDSRHAEIDRQRVEAMRTVAQRLRA